MGEANRQTNPKSWQKLSDESREALTGKLAGLWGAASDEAAFNGCAFDKQQTLLIMAARLQAKALWHIIKKIDNVYGEGGVGLVFSSWPVVGSTLSARKDFTRFLAKRKNTTGGFYEKGRAEAALHFLYVQGVPQRCYVHFDLFSPVHSPLSFFKHWRYEVIGKLTPDWRMIQQRLALEDA